MKKTPAKKKKLSAIAPSRRAHIVYLEDAHIDVCESAVVYTKTDGGVTHSYNIPYANTSMLMLGGNVTISRDGLLRLADHGVMVCVCGSEHVESMSDAVGNFQPLETFGDPCLGQYMKTWAALYLDDERSLAAAIALQKIRIKQTKVLWEKLPQAIDYGLYPEIVGDISKPFLKIVNSAEPTLASLLAAEEKYSQKIRALCLETYGVDSGDDGGMRDILRRYFNHAEYVTLGLASIVLRGLGIPYGFGIFRGRDKRNGLIYDVADIIRDGVLLPIVVESVLTGRDEEVMRNQLACAIHDCSILELLYQSIKDICDQC